MSVKRIEAWQTTTGNAYASKLEACHEEMAYLIRTKGEALKPQIDTFNFDACIEQHESLVAELAKMRSVLTGKRDKKTLEMLEGLIAKAEEWLAAADELKDNMDRVE